MPRIAPKTAPSSRVRQAARGADGQTLGQRLRACMIQRARQLGRPVDGYTQRDLIAEASRAVGRDPERAPVITQQGLSLILTNRTSESPAVPAFALALGVDAAWLQYGIGHASYAERLLGRDTQG